MTQEPRKLRGGLTRDHQVEPPNKIVNGGVVGRCSSQMLNMCLSEKFDLPFQNVQKGKYSKPQAQPSESSSAELGAVIERQLALDGEVLQAH